MADYQPVQESDLETGPQPDAGAIGSGAGDLSNYQPVNDNELIPAGGPAGQTGEFAYKGIPAAAAARFHASNPLANIFGAAATRAANNFVNTFTSNNDADMKLLLDNGYGDYSGPGSLLQHAADAINSGYTLVKNGIMAAGSAVSGAVGGAEGQIIREAGGDEASAERGEREGEFIGMAGLSDVGAMHGAAMLDAAKAGGAEAAAGEAAARAAEQAKQISTAQAQAAAPGIWGHAYRVDATPDGDLVQTPLGRLPDGAEAAEQAKTAAAALHLPDDTANLIHKTYVQTGRPPAEVLMDAQTNHGGVLDDLVAGKVPDAYQPPAEPAPKAAAPTSPRLPPEPPSLLTYISRNGGLMDEGKELSNMGVQDWHKGAPFRAKIIRDDGMELDQMRLRAQEAGYPVGDDVNSFLDAIHSEVQGKKVYSEADQARVDARREAGQYENTPEADVARDLQALGERVPPDATLQDLHDRLDERLATIGAGDVHEARHMISQAAAESEARLAGNEELSQAISEEDHHGYFGTETQSEDYRSGAGEETPAKPGGEQVAGPGTVSPSAHAEPGTGARGLSEIGQSIERKAIDQGVTDGFLQTAGYDVKTVKGQTALVSDLITKSPDEMNAIVNGEQALPHGMDPSMFIAGVESYIEQTKDWGLAARLSNSPVVTKTSEAAQTLRFAQEREPDSATAILRDIQQANEKAAGGAAKVAQKQAPVKAALKEVTNGVFVPKEDLRWEKFLDEIKC